ncbi:hypothetical protein I3F58_05330 [Streptomyces sp. MUM 203J]|uniref:hypothetical protein n=1 Tax=Streptomyces sp. MUM 203J TaxID=2791990 RepID=UPI001F045C84|nr:hypothetical protein [Streptomyces sp. MUM 203J]MCH0538986.1 hypothetical protein [Streptomyces sp. MUM 203J]
MGGEHGDRVFVRSGGRWVYNTGNPVGRVLIVVSLLVAAGWLSHMFASGRWSEGELRDAVHGAARALEAEAKPDYLLWYGGDYTSAIRDAVEATGEGPEHGLVAVDEISDDTGTGTDAGTTADRFEITTEDTSTAYCMSVSPPVPDEPRDPLAPGAVIRLSVEVEEGRC